MDSTGGRMVLLVLTFSTLMLQTQITTVTSVMLTQGFHIKVQWPSTMEVTPGTNHWAEGKNAQHTLNVWTYKTLFTYNVKMTDHTRGGLLSTPGRVGSPNSGGGHSSNPT